MEASDNMEASSNMEASASEKLRMMRIIFNCLLEIIVSHIILGGDKQDLSCRTDLSTNKKKKSVYVYIQNLLNVLTEQPKAIYKGGPICSTDGSVFGTHVKNLAFPPQTHMQCTCSS